jgi:hypothetical protein
MFQARFGDARRHKKCTKRSSSRWNLFQGLNVAFDLGGYLVLSDRRAVPKISSEAKRRVRGNPVSLFDDVGDTGYRNAQVHRHTIHAQAEWNHELLAENFTGVNGLQFPAHFRPSFIIAPLGARAQKNIGISD